jgi:aminopeptidase N
MVTALLLLTVLEASKPNASFQPKNRPYDAIHYRIDVRLNEAEKTFNNTLTATLKAKQGLNEIELDARDLTVTSVKVDGADATFTLKPNAELKTGTLNIKPAKAVPAGKQAQVVVTYSGTAAIKHEGFFTVDDPEEPDALPYFYTQFETTHAQAFFPCNDQPDDKATTEIFAIVNSKYTVLANGKKELDETFTDKGQSLRRTHWKQEQAHPTYAVALAIGVFETVAVTGDVPAEIHVLPGTTDRAFIAQDFTRFALEHQAKFVGVKYPWAKFDQVAVPQFFFSGMENTSLVMARSTKLVLDTKHDVLGRARVAGLISHELAHQWFGDYVTCRFWDDTWLNEGFATYLGEETLDAYFDNDMVEVGRTQDAFQDLFRAEEGPRSHPLVGKNGASPEEVFDDISYLKGAQVLRMLEVWLGKNEFQKGLKAYLEKHALANATSADFFAAMGAATKKDKELKAFKEAWLYKKGYPVLFPEAKYADGFLTVTIRQQPKHTSEKGPFVFKLPVAFNRQNEPKYSKEELFVIDKPVVTFKVALPAAPQWINWNKNGGALAAINVPSVSEEQWVDAARYDPDPVWRTIAAWNLLGPFVDPAAKEGTQPTDTALGAITDVLTRDNSPYVREAVLDKLARTKWKKLPAELAAPVMAIAKRPTDLADDGLGLVRVRSAALALLGKIDSAEGHRYLLEEIGKSEIDLNVLGGMSRGVARIGTTVALATLRAAVNGQKNRGYGYYRVASESLGTFESPEVVSALRELFKKNATNNELVKNTLRKVADNAVVTQSPEHAKMITDFVLDPEFSEEMQAEFLYLLDEVTTPDAKAALATIIAKTGSGRIRGAAQQALDKNFPTAPATAKGTKKKS